MHWIALSDEDDRHEREDDVEQQHERVREPLCGGEAAQPAVQDGWGSEEDGLRDETHG